MQDSIRRLLMNFGRNGATSKMMPLGVFSTVWANLKSIKKRMAYFEKSVVPIIDYYEKESKHKLIKVNGEQSVEDVHQEILEKVFK